jgi:Glyoxalase-like domain
MSLRLANVTFDCAHPPTVAAFWSAALDRPLDPDPTDHFASIGQGADNGPAWYFIHVPEPRSVKNRVHVDLVADDREKEIARLLALGATRGPDHSEYGHTWTVMSDPESNEFCLAGP